MDATNTPATPATEAAPAPVAQSEQALEAKNAEKEATAQGKKGPQDRKGTAIQNLKEMLAAKRDAAKASREAPAPAPEAAPVTEAKIEKHTAKIEAEGAKAPEQKSGESDTQYELRLARHARELRQERERASKLEKSNAVASAELAKFQKLMESGKANPLEILEHLGFSLDDVARGVVEDRFKAPKKGPTLPPELQEKLDRLEKAENERAANAARQAQTAARAEHEATVTNFVKENADRFPLAASMRGLAAAVVDEAYRQGEADIVPILETIERGLEQDVLPAYTDERALKALVKKNPDLRAKILKALGVETERPAPRQTEEAPAPRSKSVGEISSTPGTPGPKKVSGREDRVARAMANVKMARRK